MAKSKGPKGQQLKELRSQLATLKKAGLWSGDARKAKGGWRQKATVKQFADVLAGRAKTVTVDRKTARDLPKATRDAVGSVRAKGTKVVVPVRSKNERPRFDKKNKRVVSTVEMYGQKFRRIVPTSKATRVEDLPTAPKGKQYYYGLISKGGGGMRFDSKSELARFLAQYKKKESEILKYIEILEADAGGDTDYDRDESDGIYGDDE